MTGSRPAGRVRFLAPILVVILTLLLVGGAAGVGYWAGARRASSIPRVANESIAAYAPVVHRVVIDQEGVACVVAAAHEVDVPAPVTGDVRRVVVTRAGLRLHDKVGSGGLIAEVSGSPIIALHVDGVLYRDIHVGDSGGDVLALTRALREIGVLRAESKDFRWVEGEALRKLYDAVGASVPRDTQGRPIFQLGSVALIPRGWGRVSEVAQPGTDVSDSKHPVARLVFGELTAMCRVPLDRGRDFVEKTAVRMEPLGAVGEPLRGKVIERSGFRSAPGRASGASGGPAAPGNELPGYDIVINPDAEVPAWFQAERLLNAFTEVANTESTTAVPLAAIRQRGSGTFVILKGPKGDREVSVTVLRQADGWLAVAGINLDGASVRITP